MAGHCQSGEGWNRTGNGTGDLLHMILNTDPKESMLTSGHPLHRVNAGGETVQERLMIQVLKKALYI